MSAQLIFEPIRTTTRKPAPVRTGCQGIERRDPAARASTPVHAAPSPESWSPPSGAGDPATDVEGPLPFVAIPFAPAGNHVAVRSAGAIGGLLLTALLAFGVMALTAQDAAPAAQLGSAAVPRVEHRSNTMATGVFTGQFDDGVPVYRLPAIEITDARARR